VPATVEALELLKTIQSTKTHDQLTAAMRTVADRFGFVAFAISHYRVRDAEDRAELLLDGLPEGFGQRFVTRNYGKSNPISDRARQSDEPFFWHDVRYDPAVDAEGHRVMQDAASAGLVDGFCVPVLVPDGGRGLVSFLGGPMELDEDGQLALQAIGLAAHAQVLHLSPGQPTSTAKLTAREREVLRWTAAGKTADATAAILSISVRTVEYHLLNAARKMNTANRTHTVVEALRSRQLSL
jgi:LuxR family quorum sensing-dependent transcriptional regulator